MIVTDTFVFDVKLPALVLAENVRYRAVGGKRLNVTEEPEEVNGTVPRRPMF